MKPQHILINRLIKEGVIDHPIIKIKCVSQSKILSYTTRVELRGTRGDRITDYNVSLYCKGVVKIFGLHESIIRVYDDEVEDYLTI